MRNAEKLILGAAAGVTRCQWPYLANMRICDEGVQRR